MKSELIDNNRRILIVDDNPSIHADFKKILSRRDETASDLAHAEAELFGEVAAPVHHGFQLVSAYQGQEALEEVTRALDEGRPFALAFLDVRMPPGWDGIETAARLWEVDPDLQVVICTAYSDYSWDEMVKRLGASDRLVILKKPFDTIEVLQLANALSDKWRLAQQARERVEDLERMVTQRTQELRAANEALLRDIAERKRAKVALAESELSLRESQRVGRVGSYVLDIPSGIWTSSAVMNEIFGVTPSETRSFQEWQQLVHPEDREPMIAYFAEVRAQRKRFEKDYRIIRKNDGQTRWVFGVGELTLDENGEPVKMIGVIQDITERKNYEQRIVAFSNLGRKLGAAKSAKEAGRIIAAVADELLGWDACSFALYSEQHGINYVLSCDLVDGKRTECTEMDDNDPVPSKFSRMVIEKGGQLILKPDPQQKIAGASAFGDVSHPSASIVSVPVHDDAKVIGVLSIHSYSPNAYNEQSLATLQALADHCGGALSRIQAAEARAALEDQFRQVQKMDAVGQLAGGVAHDFNNILAAVLMQLGILQTEQDLTEQVRSSLRELEQEVQRGARLTRQLLMFSRRQVMQMRLLDLNHVVADMLKMLGRLLGENFEVVFSGTNMPAFVNADAGMMEQVILNLSVNARDAMPKGGKLNIAIRALEITADDAQLNSEARPGKFICLSVQDHGCGMDAGTRDRIFEPFFTTKEIGKGTGLGLATVHGIAKQHTGWIEVDSEPGKGSAFRVYFPTVPDAEQIRHVPMHNEVRGGNETILLVEDEPSLRKVASRTLKRQGYQVVEAVNGIEALAQWKQHEGKIDLLFSDVIMPEGMTGLELAEQLKKDKDELKVIVTSGYSPELAGRDTGFFRRTNSFFLQKPYPSSVLIETIRRCLDEK